MKYCVLLDAMENRAKALPIKPGVSLMQTAYKAMCCDQVQLIPLYPDRLPKGYEAITDENLMMRDGATKIFNPLASWLYGCDDHGTPILNNVVIFKVKGSNFTGMTEEEAEQITSDLNARADEIFDLTMFKVMTAR